MKKILLAFLSVIMFSVSLLAVGCNDDDNYIWANHKTFTSKNFTITASVDYIKDNSYGEDVLVLEGKNGESIVVCYNEANSTMDNTLDSFKQSLIAIDNIEPLQNKSGEININLVGSDEYTQTPAQYFSFSDTKTWTNSVETVEREKFYIHYSNVVDEYYYNWLVVTAKAGDGYVVAYIGGVQSNFNKKFDEYLTYAKSLIVKPLDKTTDGYGNIFSSEMKYTTESVFASSGLKYTIPKNFMYYSLDGDIQDNLIVADMVNENKQYGDISIRAYDENWTSFGGYGVLNVDMIALDEYEINKHLVKIGSDKILGYYFKNITVTENEEHYQGGIRENMYFKFRAGNRTYAFEVVFNIYYEDDITQSDYENYVFHTKDVEIYKCLYAIESNIFEWVKLIELL